MTSQAPGTPDYIASDDAALPQSTDEVDDRASVPVSGPAAISADAGAPVEIGGRPGPEPTRYGDWEMRGRCIDF